MALPFFVESEWDDATVTSSEEATGFDDDNVQRQGIKHKWGTDDVTGAKTITLEAASIVSIGCVVMHRHNGTGSGTWRVRVADTVGGLPSASGDKDSGDVTMWATTDMGDFSWRSVFWIPNSAITGKAVQIEINDGTNPAGYFRAGRVIIGARTTWNEFPLAGQTNLTDVQDYSPVERNTSGAMASAIPQETRLHFSKSYLTTTLTGAVAISKLAAKNGEHTDIAAVGDSDATDYISQNFGVFRFPRRFRMKAQSQIGPDEGAWSANMNLGAV